jgi:RNA polymerase sigma-70 factor (ECF subfamily)
MTGALPALLADTRDELVGFVTKRVGDRALAEDRSVCQCVARLKDTLKPEYAAAITRVEIDDVPVKDYAAETGISASAAAVRVFRARDALRKQLAVACGACAEHACFDCTCGGG